jgi:hypothetical protein
MNCNYRRFTRVSFLFILFLQTAASQGTIQQLLNNGPNDKRINIVFLSEGYTASQLNQYIVDATNNLNSFLNTPPHSLYKKFFNAFAISIASIDSGSDHPSRNESRNTYFNSTYDSYGIARLISLTTEGSNNASALLQTLMPEYDIVIIIVNDAEYGGSGGAFAITSVNSNALEIVVHELGHSFAGLGDEYPDAYPGYPEIEEPNTTKETIREKIKWNSWIANSTPIPTSKTTEYNSVVGLFEGAHYHATGWYRPKLNCKMQSLSSSFCEVCSETFVISYYQFIRPIESYTPISSSISLSDTQSVNLSVTSVKPTLNTMKIEWFVDGIKLNGESGSTFNIVTKNLSIGEHTAYCIVRDTTLLVRNDPTMILRDSISWKISVSNTTNVDTDNSNKIPSQFSLEQNFPNPFNPITTIAFSLPSASFVTLKIYDVIGREVETLIAQEMSSGRLTQQWNASNISGGIYICELRAGNYKKTIKLALIK